VSGDGAGFLVVYITGDRQPADRADVRWEQDHITLALSRMRPGTGGRRAAIYHCVAVPVSGSVTDRILIDGATGERASAKRSTHLAPGPLRPRTLDAVFEPRELLEPREITGVTQAEVDPVEGPWRPVPVEWEGVRLSEDGTRLFAAYITGSPQPADRADVRWDEKRLTLTLSRLFEGDIETAAAFYHCVEVPLSQSASDRIPVDGATGERASNKKSDYLDPEFLQRTERTLDEVFEPRELLAPREVAA
jgi:hypothetical protein